MEQVHMTNPTYHLDLTQGSHEWHQARLGVLTASTMKHLFTKGLAPSKGATPETLLYQLAGERINGWAPDSFVSYDMERGKFEEMEAAMVYAENCAGLQNCGFITNDKWGFTLGYSPDGLAGEDGLIEVKSRAAKYQVRTIFDSIIDGDKAPDEFMLQMQTGMLVAERDWCDFISYSNGMPMAVIRVEPDLKLQNLIVDVATDFHAKLATMLRQYDDALQGDARLYPTIRNDYHRDPEIVL